MDAILNQSLYDAQQQGVTLKVSGYLPSNCRIETYDLCTIFANLLKNAVEASAFSKEKTVELSIKNKDEEIMIRVRNTYFGGRKKNGETYLTTKRQAGHGIGLNNIKESVERYQGKLLMMEEHNMFVTMISLKNT